MKGHGVNLKTDSIHSKCENSAENKHFQDVQDDPSSKNHWRQTVWARILKIYTIIDHVPNNLNLKWHGVNVKTVDLTVYTVNVKIPPKISIFKYVQDDPSSMNPWIKTVRARILKIYTIIDHVPNDLNLTGHIVNLKTVGLTRCAVNVKIPPK